MSIRLETLNFDIERTLNEIEIDGGTSVPILPEESRRILLEEARGYEFDYMMPIGFRFHRGLSGLIHRKNKFELLGHIFQEFFDRQCQNLPRYPFDSRLEFTHMTLNFYKNGSPGLQKHSDPAICRNLICIFVIDGRCRFLIYPATQSREDYKELDSSPGNLIILRAPGFYGMNDCIPHSVSDVSGVRYSFVLRQHGSSKLQEGR